MTDVKRVVIKVPDWTCKREMKYSQLTEEDDTSAFFALRNTGVKFIRGGTAGRG